MYFVPLQLPVNISTLEEENRRLKEENTKLKHDNQQLTKQVEDLLKLVGDFKGQILSHENRLENLQQQLTSVSEDTKNLIKSNAALREDNLRLENSNKDLSEKIQNLQASNVQLREQVDKLENNNKLLLARVLTLEEQDKLKYAHVLAADLANIYKFYYVFPALKDTKWGDFSKEYNEKKDAVQDAKLSQTEFDSWLSPLQSKVGVPFSELMPLIKDRNDEFHQDIRSATNQTTFLEELKSFSWPSSYPHTALVTTMVKTLETTPKKRLIM